LLIEKRYIIAHLCSRLKFKIKGRWKWAKNYGGGKILSKNNLPEGKNGAGIGREGTSLKCKDVILILAFK